MPPFFASLLLAEERKRISASPHELSFPQKRSRKPALWNGFDLRGYLSTGMRHVFSLLLKGSFVSSPIFPKAGEEKGVYT